jgi:hypothetical protein
MKTINFERYEKPYGGHGYRHEGKKVNSVTTILGCIGDFSEWAKRYTANYAVTNWDSLANLGIKEREESILSSSKNYTNYKADIGTQVHDWIEKTLNNQKININDYSLEAKKYINTASNFLAENNIKPVMQECIVFNKKENYAGTLDAIITFGNDTQKWIVDWKTSNIIQPKTALQLSAYANAEYIAEKKNPNNEATPINLKDCRTAIIHITKEGYSLIETKNDEETYKKFLLVRDFHYSTTNAQLKQHVIDKDKI